MLYVIKRYVIIIVYVRIHDDDNILVYDIFSLFIMRSCYLFVIIRHPDDDMLTN